MKVIPVYSQNKYLPKAMKCLISINIAANLCCLLRDIPFGLFGPSSTECSDLVLEPTPIRGRNVTRRWSRLRMRVLCRDHFRCRGCDRKGDEITICIHLIESGGCDLDAMLTLCTQCEHLANEMKLQGASIPDFLRLLWRHLHHPEPELECIRTPHAG